MRSVRSARPPSTAARVDYLPIARLIGGQTGTREGGSREVGCSFSWRRTLEALLPK